MIGKIMIRSNGEPKPIISCIQNLYLKNIGFLRFSWLLKEKNNLSAEAYSH
jgi:hypothetical protein